MENSEQKKRNVQDSLFHLVKLMSNFMFLSEKL